MASQHGRLFNSLSGRELRRAIIREVEDLLENDDRFNSNIAYPKVSFRFDLSLKVYPREPESFALSTEKVYGESDSAPVEVSLSREHEHEHPDKTRMASGDPIPHPQKVAHVGTVDLTGEQVEQSLGLPERHYEVEIPISVEEIKGHPLIIPATEMPSEPVHQPKHMVPVGGVNGPQGNREVEIAGHETDEHVVDLEEGSMSPAVKVSISNSAAVTGKWAERHGHGKPVDTGNENKSGRNLV